MHSTDPIILDDELLLIIIVVVMVVAVVIVEVEVARPEFNHSCTKSMNCSTLSVLIFLTRLMITAAAFSLHTAALSFTIRRVVGRKIICE